jgi:hypothetical protein
MQGNYQIEENEARLYETPARTVVQGTHTRPEIVMLPRMLAVLA